MLNVLFGLLVRERDMSVVAEGGGSRVFVRIARFVEAEGPVFFLGGARCIGV